MGDTESVEVHSVDACIVELCVQEDSLDSAWHLSQSRGSREEPAVAEGTLVDILNCDTIFTEQSVRAEDLTGSLPRDA